MTAKEALFLTNENIERNKCLEKHICYLNNKIKKMATRGNRHCIVNFYYYTVDGGYNFKNETFEHFENNGFSFELIRDDVCGGVKQDPYWIIKW